MILDTTAISPRDAAREWIAEMIAKHLHPDLTCDGDRISQVAAAFEAEADERNLRSKRSESWRSSGANPNEKAGLHVVV